MRNDSDYKDRISPSLSDRTRTILDFSIPHVREKLQVNPELVVRMLTQFLKDEITRIGFERAVFGLSGGVDSSVVAYLLARSFPRENLLALVMPYKSSSPESVEDALLVVKELGIPHRVVDITPMIDSYFERYEPDASPLRRGNKMARERMSVLYDHSAKLGALVVGTTNKTELLLGYGTLFGDLACAVNPLGDMFKTQVWQVASYLGVPERIVKKSPTADLWAGQTDEGELGYTYYLADEILYLMIDERMFPEEIIKMGYPAEVVKDIKSRVIRFQFKRRPPLIAKLSWRTVEHDFRYPRDWGS